MGEATQYNEKLTGADYMTRPYLQLVGHPDYSPLALRIMQAIGKMTTEQIEDIDVVSIIRSNRT